MVFYAAYIVISNLQQTFLTLIYPPLLRCYDRSLSGLPRKNELTTDYTGCRCRRNAILVWYRLYAVWRVDHPQTNIHNTCRSYHSVGVISLNDRRDIHRLS